MKNVKKTLSKGLYVFCKQPNCLFFLLALFVCFIQVASAQGIMPDESDRFTLEKVRSDYYYDWKHSGLDVDLGVNLDVTASPKGRGISVFKRWEHFMGKRMPRYDFLSGDVAENMWEAIQQQNIALNKSQNVPNPNACESEISWKEVSDRKIPADAQSEQGYGKLNFVKFYPDTGKPNTVYVGSPSGGIWVKDLTQPNSLWKPLSEYNLKYNNGGSTDISVLGASDLAIHPTNPQIMWVVTGDINKDHVMLHPYSIGVLKTTDAGKTWTKCSIPENVPEPYYSYENAVPKKIIINKSNPDILYSATTTSVCKSTDAGQNFALKMGTFNLSDISFKPDGNYSTIYAVFGQSFCKSIDEGAIWIIKGITNTPTTIKNSKIATHPDQPEYIYIVSSNDEGGLEGIYVSKNSGDSFTKIYGKSADEYNILSRSKEVKFDITNPSKNTGQGNYDLAITVDPADTEGRTLYIGSINIYKLVLNTDLTGVDSCKLVSYWQPTKEADYVHSDIHDLKIKDNKLVTACGGGIYEAKTNGNAPLKWQNTSQGLGIRQCNYFANYENGKNKIIISGAQNNGIQKISLLNNNFSSKLIGIKNDYDGAKCIINPNNPKHIYTSIQHNEVLVSTNGGKTFSVLMANSQSDNYNLAKLNAEPNEKAAFVSKALAYDAANDLLFVGYNSIYVISNPTSTNPIKTKIADEEYKWYPTIIKVAPSNPNIVFYTNKTDIFKIEKAPNEPWTFVKQLTHLDAPSLRYSAISDFVIHPTNPDIVWVSLSNFNEHEKKVLKITKLPENEIKANKKKQGYYPSYNAEIVGSGLPKIPVTSLALDTTNIDKERLFAGTDCGVYYIENCTDPNKKNQWLPLQSSTPTNTLPNVIVSELEIVGTAPNKLLRAATFGRGIWETNISNLNTNCTCICPESNVPCILNDNSANIDSVNNQVNEILGSDIVITNPKQDTKGGKTDAITTAADCPITQISLRPNPTHSNTVLECTLNPLWQQSTEKTTVPLHIEIYNATGQKLKQLNKTLIETESKQLIELETNNLPPGLYNLVLYSCQQTHTVKLVKN